MQGVGGSSPLVSTKKERDALAVYRSFFMKRRATTFAQEVRKVVRILAAERVVLALKRQGKEYWREATKPTCLSKIEGTPKGCPFLSIARAMAYHPTESVSHPLKAALLCL